MPVYNGEKYIRQALDSLLAQDYGNFELIISDNASTDGTHEICREYLAKDSRIKYFRNEKNMGAAWNFERVFRLSQGKYFMWAAHDDLWAPNYVSECVRVLEQSPEAVLCCSALRFIDANGDLIPKEHPNLDTRGMTLFGRVRALLLQPDWFAIYGLMRSEALNKVNVGRREWGADVLLQLELLMLGDFVCAYTTVFYYRILGKSAKDQDVAIEPSRASKPLQRPFTGLVLNLMKTVLCSELTLLEKAICLVEIVYFGLIHDGHLSSYVHRENLHEYFVSFGNGDARAVVKSAPLAFLLNPQIWLNRGAWAILARSLYSVLKAGIPSKTETHSDRPSAS